MTSVYTKDQRRIQEFAMGEADPGFQFGGGTWRAR